MRHQDHSDVARLSAEGRTRHARRDGVSRRCSVAVRAGGQSPDAPDRVSPARVGAEKLRQPSATAFKEKFGVDLLEGYGCTEMAPVVAANVPDVDDGPEHQRGARPGSVGHPLPGVAAKIVDPDTGDGPLFGRE